VKKSESTFYFSGQDSLSQFMLWILVLGAGFFPLPFLVWWFGGKTAAITSVAIALVVLVGFRASIAVSPSGVVVTKSWFFVPYWRFKGPAIEDVWFGGDWGEPEGASGVVVKIRGKEIHVGSRKSMHQLHAALFPLRVVARESPLR
jgi:hypothetical protein